ncbi:MAG: ABC transporter substrate-binding protein [Ilumatobacter sp.]|nr:ABC transporter substrate-binding protein [Ilumatobacter sp.]
MGSFRKSVALAAVLGLAFTACGGDDDDGGSSDNTAEETSDTTADDGGDEGSGDTTADEGDEGDDMAEEPTGEPIKLMSVTTLNANGPTYENIAITAELAADYINANGGINGRPVEVSVCDEQFDAAVAATCAREAVEEGVVSVVGSFTYFAEAIVPVIAESDITWFGNCCAISPSELSDPHSFPIGNQPMYSVGEVKRAVEDGCENINAVIAEGADAIFRTPMENAISAYGRSFGDVIITPTIAQDYSAEVAQATTDADCIVVVMSETPFLTWNTALQQADTDVKQYGNQGNLNAISAKGAEEVTNGNIIAGMYPDISTAPWDEYRAALDAAGVDQEANDFNSLGGMGTWAAYMGFAQIASTIEGEVTAASFYEAASNTSSLDLNGMVPVLDFTTEWTDGLEGYSRLFNRSVVYSMLENGQVVPVDNEFVDVSDLAVGTPQG